MGELTAKRVTEIKGWAEALLDPANWPGIAYGAATSRGHIVAGVPEICASWLAMYGAIQEARDAHGDDRCWMDMDRIVAAAGLPVPDRRVGDKAAMLANCGRFIGRMCEGGGWKSYAELEAENADLKGRLAALESQAARIGG